MLHPPPQPPRVGESEAFLSYFPKSDDSPSFPAISSSASDSPGDRNNTEYNVGPTPRLLRSSGTPLIPGTTLAARSEPQRCGFIQHKIDFWRVGGRRPQSMGK